MKENEYIIQSNRAGSIDWTELWRYRELFYFFAWRDIKIKYKQTALGVVWVVLQPILTTLITTLVFGQTLKVPSQGIPYPVFVFSGLLIWNIVSAGLTGAGNSMVSNSAIIKKIYFPRLVIPVSSIIGALFDFTIALVIFVPVLIYYKQPVSLTAVFYWPAATLLALIATLGPGSWLAALNIKYRDFRYVIPFLLQVLFFITPILYPATMLSNPVLKYVVLFSPAYAAVELFRAPITGIPPDLTLMVINAAFNVVLLVIGVYYFRRSEDFFADFA